MIHQLYFLSVRCLLSNTTSTIIFEYSDDKIFKEAILLLNKFALPTVLKGLKETSCRKNHSAQDSETKTKMVNK